MSKGTARMFGVELEGYLTRNMVGECLYEDGLLFEVKDDGSLNNKRLEVTCDCCGGEGSFSILCDNNECEDGVCLFTDSYGNNYKFNCKECFGNGSRESDCDECGGSGKKESTRIYGLEIVSPKLTDANVIKKLYGQMHEMGWHVDDAAGLHIHVNASDYQGIDFYKLLMLMTAVEPVIYSITNSYRYDESSYSTPLTYDDYTKREVKRLLERNPDDISIGDIFFTDERYTALNYLAFQKHNTVEFRHFYPQKNAEKVCNYVELVTKLVDFAKFSSVEQLTVVYNKLINNTYAGSAEVLKEVLGLSFCLLEAKENRTYERYTRIRFTPYAEQVEQIEMEDAV